MATEKIKIPYSGKMIGLIGRIGPIKIKYRNRSYLILGILALSAFLLLRTPKEAEAWWSDTYGYRKPIRFTNSGSDIDDARQVKVDVDTATLIAAGKMQADCDDTRFIYNGQEVEYYIDDSNSSCDDASTDYYVVLPKVATGPNTIWMYYSNSSASNNEKSQEYGEKSAAWWEHNSSTGTAEDLYGGYDFSNSGVTNDSGPGSMTGGQYELSETDYQDRDPTDLAQGASDRSYVIWAKPESLTALHTLWASGGGAGDGSDGGTWIYVNASGQIVMNFSDGDGDGRINRTCLSVFTVGEWTMVAITQDRDGNMSFYYNDGVFDRASSMTAHQSSFNDTAMTIGAFYSITHYFDGVMGDVVILDRALSSEEISWFYNSGNGRVFSDMYYTPSSGPTVGSEEQAPTPLAYWKFDEGTGTTAQDSSDNNNDGTIDGATWQTEDMCVSGKCLYFDGSNDYVEIPDSASEFNFTTNDSFSLQTWIKVVSLPQVNNSILDNFDGTGGYVLSVRDQSGDVNIGFTANGVLARFGSIDLEFNQWYHVTTVYDAGNVYSYINGVEDLNTTIPSITSSSANMFIGRRGATSAFYPHVFLDEVKIYPYALTADQVKAQYTGMAGKRGSSAVLGAALQSESLSEGLIGYWKMDESSGDRSDSSGNGNTLTDIISTGSETGVYGLAAKVNGADNDYLAINDNTTISTGDIDFTIAGWFRLNAEVTYNYAITKWNNYGSNQREWGLDYSDGTYEFVVSPNGSNPSTYVDGTNFGSVAIGDWHYVIGWHDSVNNTINIQVDNTTPNSVSYSGGVFDSNSPIIFGALPAFSKYSYMSFDEVRYYKRVLSPDERRRLYEWAPGPVGHWKMDDAVTGNSQTIKDSSGNGLDGTTAGTAPDCNKIGKYGKACDFSADRIVLGSPNALDDLHDNALTVTAWVNPDSWNISESAIYHSSGWFFNIRSSLGLSGYVYGDSTAISRSGTDDFDIDGLWHHVAMTYDDAGDRKIWLFVDGQPVPDYDGQIAVSGSITSDASSDKAIGGRSTGGPSTEWDGMIDDVQIYNYALNEKQIVNVMNGRSVNDPGVGSPIGHAVGEWSFDEGYGTTANDTGLGGNNGTLANLASPATPTSGWQADSACRQGKCLAFDGTDDYVDLGTGLDNNSEVSISAWINTDTIASGTRQIVANADSVGSAQDYTFEINRTAGKLSTVWGNSVILTGNTTLSTNTWYHTAMVRSGSSGNWTAKLYINGKEDNSGTSATNPNATDEITTIGRLGDAFAQQFSGKIDEVKIYNFALSADDVKTLYNLGSSQVLGHNSSATDMGYQTNRWYEAGGAPTPVAAYQPLGASSQAESYTNLANPGTYDAIVGDAPTWASGTGWTFDGSTEYLDTGLKPAVDQTWSVFMRFSNPGSAGYYPFGARQNTSAEYWHLRLEQVSNRAGFSYDNGLINLTDTLTAGVMGMSGRECYVDGVNVGTLNSGTIANGQDYTAYIGAQNYSSPSFKEITIEALAIYDQTLTADQVYAVSKAMENLESTETPYQPPVAEWTLNEGTGGSANDTSGNANTGTITGATWAKCTANGTNCLSFDGDDDYVSLGDLGVTTGSLSMWLNSTETSGTADRRILSQASGLSTQQGSLSINPITQVDNCDEYDVCVWPGSSPWKRVTNVSSDWSNEWHHLVVVYESGNATGYWDGVQHSTTPSTFDFSGVIATLGGHFGSGQFGNTFSGKIDQVKIYDYALSPAQIAYEYNGGGPVAHYKFDECQGTTAYDSSGHGNNGTIYSSGSGGNTSVGTCGGSSGEMWADGATGKYNNSLDFDGTNDYVTLGTPDEHINETGTVSAWIKPAGLTGIPFFFGTQESDPWAAGGGSILMRVRDSSGWKAELVYPTGSASSLYGTSTISTGNWYHLTATYDGSAYYLYVNGVLENSVSYSGNDLISDQEYRIGGGYSGGYWNGQIDDVKIFNYALGATEVRKLYNQGSSVQFGPSEGSP